MGGHRARTCLADLRLAVRISAWFAPRSRIRDILRMASEIDIDRLVRDWALPLAGISGPLQPGRDMASFFSTELETGRISRPLYAPYVTTDSIASYHWAPSGGPHLKSLGRWSAAQSAFTQNTGGGLFSGPVCALPGEVSAIRGSYGGVVGFWRIGPST